MLILLTLVQQVCLSVGDLERDTEYNVKVFARNVVFEGTAAQKTVRTKSNGKMPAAFID